MAYINPDYNSFSSQFARDFPFGTDVNNNVTQGDVEYAFQFTNISINQGFFTDQGSYTLGYNLLAAHYLVTNLRASSQGINGQYNWLQVSKAVGQVNEAFAIPQYILNNPLLSSFSKTNYGQAYLAMILPNLVGFMYGVCGPAHAL